MTSIDDGTAWTFGAGGFAKLYGDRLAQSSLLDRDVATRWVFVFMLSQADAQGRYRLSVGQGRYFFAAGMVGAATYYPAETDVERATAVTIGTTPQTLDIKLTNPLAGRIHGRLTPPPVRGILPKPTF